MSQQICKMGSIIITILLIIKMEAQNNWSEATQVVVETELILNLYGI